MTAGRAGGPGDPVAADRGGGWVTELDVELAALAAGGTLRYDAKAPAFWPLADAEGNEACITTWQGRDG